MHLATAERRSVRLYAHCLRPSLLISDSEREGYKFRSLNEITPAYLHAHDIKGIGFDVDNTLCPKDDEKVHESVAERFHELTDAFPSCIVSNTDPERRAALEHMFGIPAIQTDIRKPLYAPFSELMAQIMQQLGCPIERTHVAMIGDRRTTDIAGGNMYGLFTSHIDPFPHWGGEPKSHTFLREFEDALARFYIE